MARPLWHCMRGAEQYHIALERFSHAQGEGLVACPRFRAARGTKLAVMPKETASTGSPTEATSEDSSRDTLVASWTDSYRRSQYASVTRSKRPEHRRTSTSVHPPTAHATAAMSQMNIMIDRLSTSSARAHGLSSLRQQPRSDRTPARRTDETQRPTAATGARRRKSDPELQERRRPLAGGGNLSDVVRPRHADASDNTLTSGHGKYPTRCTSLYRSR